MPAAVTVQYQKVGLNFKRTLFNIVLSGTYPTLGETVTLTSGASNPQATTISGPSGTPKLGGASGEIVQLGGWQPTLTPTTNGAYTLQFWNGTTQLTNISYPAAISGGVLVVAVDHEMQGL